MILLIPALFGILLLSFGAYSWHHIPWSSDTLLAVIPDYFVNIQSYKSGSVPLWDPNLGCGHPHFAKWLPACLYPPCALLIWTGIQGLFFLTFLHAGWAFLGFFLWLRSQKSSIPFSLLGALSFVGSAHFVRCWLDSPFIFTLSWIPWIFWAFDKTLKKNRSHWRTLPVFFLSLQILAGYPFFVFYTWILLGIWILYQSSFPKQWKDLALIFGLSLGLSSVQWLPFLEFVSSAVRGNWEHFPYFTQPIECLTLFQPHLAGDPSNETYRGYPANGNFGNLYFGLIPFVLFIAGWFSPSRFQARFWNFSALGFFLWLLGPHFLPLRLLPAKALEILEPSKAVGLFIFCACTSVAITFSRLLENHKPKKNWRPWLWAAGAFWALDILVLPFRLIHWVPNPYQDPCIDQTWRTFAPKIEGFRAVSLQLPNQWTSNHLEQLSQENAKLLMMNTNVFWGIRSANGYLSTQTQALSNLAKYFMKGFPYRGDLLDVAGAKFLILPQIPPGGKYKVVGRAWEDYILFNPNAAPRGWPVSDTEYFPGRRAILQALAGTGNSWRQKVFLENTSDGTPIALEPVKRDLTPSNPETGLATRMAFNADIQKPGYWVFNETWAPGWHAWVDENPRPLLRAYGLFMAVPVSEGKHRVEFRYEPTSFRLGLFLVFLSLPLLGVIFYRRDKPSTVKTTISI